MISLEWLFYLLIVFFGLIGSLRGWQKEVIAFAGLIGSISALTQFGYLMVTLIGSTLNQGGAPLEPVALQKQQFWIQFLFHVTIAFFSYQVIARLADNAKSSRIGDRLRMGFQNRFIGAIVGFLNGYLLVGGMWGLLEYRVTEIGYERIPAGTQYIFAPNITAPELTSNAINIVPYLPFGLINPALWLLIFFISFFIVIIALI